MISLETIEELETKIMKALELISDLRAENNRLESDNETLRAENDQMKLAMEEKEREIASLREQLAQSLKELDEYKSKEKKLDNKIHEYETLLDLIVAGIMGVSDRTRPDYLKKLMESY